MADFGTSPFNTALFDQPLEGEPPSVAMSVANGPVDLILSSQNLRRIVVDGQQIWPVRFK